MKALQPKTVGNGANATDARADQRATADQRPCLQIQMDLSAMLDGELDSASIRRVMVHSDVCECCKAFLGGIRAQLVAHQTLAPVIAGTRTTAATRLTRQLCENRDQLAKIFYELGRGFVLMGVSPDFTRLVEREPVPIPDVFMRGRNLLDEVQRSIQQSIQRSMGGDERPALTNVPLGTEWVRAQSLFQSGHLGTPQENLVKGKKLLAESLMLRPDFHQARIYLGHAHQVAGECDQARREFSLVLEQSTDPMMRIFALLHLGSAFIEDHQEARAIPHLLELVQSKIDPRHEMVFATIFNLALAHGRLGQLAEAQKWFTRLYAEFPHKRRVVGQWLKQQTLLATALAQQPGLPEHFAAAFPGWFPIQECA